MENIEILNFITSVKLSENNNYATLPLSIEVEQLPLMFNMKMNFNLLGNNSDEIYYIMLEMVNMQTKERALKFYETVVMSKFPWGFQLNDGRMATALNFENITNVVEEKGDYYLELSLQDQNGNLVTKAKQFLRIN